MRNYSSLLLSFFLVFFSLNSAAQVSNTEKPINILVLHSYSHSYEWTKNIEDGIKNTTKNSDKPIRLSMEYMDSKRIKGDAL